MFLKSIDGTTAHLRSEGDDFRDSLRLQGPVRRQGLSTPDTMCGSHELSAEAERPSCRESQHEEARLRTSQRLWVVVFASPVLADFVGPYDVGNWDTTLTGSPPGGGSLIDTSGAPASIEIVGGDLGCFGTPCNLDFTIAAVASGFVSFDWGYETTDFDGPSHEHFGFLLNGFFTQVSDDGGGISQSGSEAFAVSLSDVFGFRLDCTDCVAGPAFVTISSFSAPLVLLRCLSRPRCCCWAAVCWRGPCSGAAKRVSGLHSSAGCTARHLTSQSWPRNRPWPGWRRLPFHPSRKLRPLSPTLSFSSAALVLLESVVRRISLSLTLTVSLPAFASTDVTVPRQDCGLSRSRCRGRRRLR